MSQIYLLDNGSVMSEKGGHFIIKQKDLLRKIPKETVESVTVFGNSSITTPCMHTLLEKSIPVCYFSSRGKYFGRLESTENSNIKKVHRQIITFDNAQFCNTLAQSIIAAKIRNQEIILYRYRNYAETEIKRELQLMKQYERKARLSNSISELMGIEGIAARTYFGAIRKIIRTDFKFDKRNRRPPKDAFNSMLSLGYTLLMYEIVAQISNIGMTAYYGFFHSINENHPTLASDLMEEWRPVLVDSVVLSMIQGNEISITDFTKDENSNGVFMTNSAIKKFVRKFENKLNTQTKYLKYDSCTCSYRNALSIQCKMIETSIRRNDPVLYQPIIIK